MSTKNQTWGSCLKFDSTTVSIGQLAGQSHTSGTGGMYLGYGAGIYNVSGPRSIGIGAGANPGTVNSTTSGVAVAIGANAQVNNTSPSNGCIALGRDSVCTTSNSIVLGGYSDVLEAGPVITEFGPRRQYFYTTTYLNSSYSLAGTTGANKMLNGWLDFLDITADCTLQLPDAVDILAVWPNWKIWSCGELLIHNYNTGGFVITVIGGAGSNWNTITDIRSNSTVIARYRVEDVDLVEFYP